MERCSDFVNEKTLLQVNLSKLGIEVHQSPKCHSELAREEIEYSWRFANNYYRQLPLKLKRKRKFSRAASNLQCHKRESQRRLWENLWEEHVVTLVHTMHLRLEIEQMCNVRKYHLTWSRSWWSCSKCTDVRLTLKGKYIVKIEKEESSSKSNRANSPKQVAWSSTAGKKRTLICHLFVIVSRCLFVILM